MDFREVYEQARRLSGPAREVWFTSYYKAMKREGSYAAAQQQANAMLRAQYNAMQGAQAGGGMYNNLSINWNTNPNIGTTGTNPFSTITTEARWFDGDVAPSQAKLVPKVGSNLAWLDQRVNEMRVRL